MWISRKNYEELQRHADRNAGYADRYAQMRNTVGLGGIYRDVNMTVVSNYRYDKLVDDLARAREAQTEQVFAIVKGVDIDEYSETEEIIEVFSSYDSAERRRDELQNMSNKNVVELCCDPIRYVIYELEVKA